MAGDNDGLVCAPICDAINPDIGIITTGTYGTVEVSTTRLTVFMLVSPYVGGACELTDVASLQPVLVPSFTPMPQDCCRSIISSSSQVSRISHF